MSYLFLGLVACQMPVTQSSTSRYLCPIAAVDIGDFVDPSGITFCNTTGHVYVICDEPKCHYIYELYTNGTSIEKWGISKDHDDIESISCDDINGLLYIVEEENMRVSSYVLPIAGSTDTYTGSKDPQLIQVNNFTVATHGGDPNSGLEGIAVDIRRNLLYVAYEKKPRMYYTLDLVGNELNLTYPYFSGDISGLAYDDTQDLVWVLSDQSARLFLTDIHCEIVYDYWDLPMQNSEGVAINYLVDPPELYITTDPSSPGSVPYVPGMFTFFIPEIGTGLKYPAYIPESCPECKGCTEVYSEIKEINDAFNLQVKQQAEIYGLYLLGIVGILFIPIIIALIVLLIKTLKQYNPDDYPDGSRENYRNTTAEASLWKDLFWYENEKTNKPTRLAGTVPNSNFEDDRF